MITEQLDKMHEDKLTSMNKFFNVLDFENDLDLLFNDNRSSTIVDDVVDMRVQFAHPNIRDIYNDIKSTYERGCAPATAKILQNHVGFLYAAQITGNECKFGIATHLYGRFRKLVEGATSNQILIHGLIVFDNMALAKEKEQYFHTMLKSCQIEREYFALIRGANILLHISY